jgi:hypothetical protein
MLRGELRLKLAQTELAECDFREAITLAQKMSAKAWRTMSWLWKLKNSSPALTVILGWT